MKLPSEPHIMAELGGADRLVQFCKDDTEMASGTSFKGLKEIKEEEEEDSISKCLNISFYFEFYNSRRSDVNYQLRIEQ